MSDEEEKEIRECMENICLSHVAVQLARFQPSFLKEKGKGFDPELAKLVDLARKYLDLLLRKEIDRLGGSNDS